MGKIHTTLSIDDKVLKQAKEMGYNISGEVEKFLRERAGITQVDIIKPEKCQFCGKEEEKATGSNPIGLTWLYPDEMWICNSCLQNKIKKMLAAS